MISLSVFQINNDDSAILTCPMILPYSSRMYGGDQNLLHTSQLTFPKILFFKNCKNGWMEPVATLHVSIT